MPPAGEKGRGRLRRVATATRAFMANRRDLVNDEAAKRRQERYMTKIIYEVVEHDWAYQVDGVFSETFPSHDLAREAADRAAKEQIVPGEATGISYEDRDGRWHDEASPGGDR